MVRQWSEHRLALDFGGGLILFPGLCVTASSSEVCRFPSKDVMLSWRAFVTSFDTFAGEGPRLSRLESSLLLEGGIFIGDGDAEDGIRVSTESISGSVG